MLTQPECLLAQVLKARYFPRIDFLSANLGSLTRRSVWSTRGLIEKGYGWRIGSGQQVWNDPWLPSPGPGRVTCAKIDIRYSTVNHLIYSQVHTWDEGNIRLPFKPAEVDRILNIPIAQTATKDELVWRLEGSGDYTVKTGYRLFMQDNLPSLLDTHKNFLSKLWELKHPSKIKIYIWKLWHNYIPHKVNLCRRNIQVDDLCPLCKNAAETIDHMV